MQTAAHREHSEQLVVPWVACRLACDPVSSRCTCIISPAAARFCCSAALLISQKHNAVPGSCTALVAQLRPSAVLEVCLVGDVGLRLIRSGRVTAATEVRGRLAVHSTRLFGFFCGMHVARHVLTVHSCGAAVDR
jgi:hypothetical protein